MAKKWLSDTALMEQAAQRLLASNLPFQIDAETQGFADRLLARARELGEELDPRLTGERDDDIECPECDYPFNTVDECGMEDYGQPGFISCNFCGHEFLDPNYNTDDDEDVDDEEDK